MIRFIYDEEGHEIQATASGCASEIVSELGVLINISYNLIRSRSPKAAEAFRHGLLVSLVPCSPVWEKESVPDPCVGVKIIRICDDKKEA